MNQISLRDFQLKPTKYLSELPIELTTYNKVVAIVSAPGLDEVSELKRQIDLQKGYIEELEKGNSKPSGVPTVSNLESPLISKEEKLKALREMMKTPFIEVKNEYHKCQWKFGCIKEAVEEVEDAEFDGVKAVRFKKFYCKIHSAKARQNIDKFEAEGTFI